MSTENAKVGVGRLAGRQRGRVTRAQLEALRVTSSTVAMWLNQGYLHRLLPRVYGVGHPARSTEADLAAALLYAGPGAMLSHATAAWWLGLLDERPRQIHVSTPRRCRSLPGIKVHQRRACPRINHKRLPTTAIPQTLVDLAAKAPLRTVRRALAKADYKGTLDIPAIQSRLGPGRPGSAKLRLALERHQPKLARTKSRLEAMFFEICEDAGFELPELNQYVGAWEVDALWRDKRIAVELDGYGNHHSPAQLRRDRRKEMDLRVAGYTPARYSEEQLEQQRQKVIADVRRLRDAA
jgi:predicted transcriptional regulator of viral defense system